MCAAHTEFIVFKRVHCLVQESANCLKSQIVNILGFGGQEAKPECYARTYITPSNVTS